MLKDLKTDVKTLVLLKLTKRIIENTPSIGIYKLAKLTQSPEKIERPIRINIPSTKEEIREKIKQEVKEKLSYIPSIKIKEGDSFIIVEQENKKRMEEKIKNLKNKKFTQHTIKHPIQPPINPPIKKPINQPRRPPIPMPQAHNLPPHLQYLKPTMEQIRPKEIDLGKLNPFIQDRNVKTIETEGPDEPVYVSGSMGRKPTAEKLSEFEIKEIIEKFSKESKVPTTEGIFKVLVGHLQLTAMISESIGTRFIIKKIQ